MPTLNDLILKIPVTLRNIIWLALGAVLTAVPVLLGIAWIAHFSVPASPLTNIILPEYADHIAPENEMLVYRLFVVSVCVLQGIFLIVFRRRLNDEGLFASLRWVLAAGGLFALAGLSYFFRSVLLEGLLSLWPGVLGLAVLAAVAAFLGPRINIPKAGKVLVAAADISAPVVILLLFFIPQRAGTIAKIFANDRFNHFDTFLAGPGWAVFSGLKLNIDIFSEYGFGMPLFLAQVVRWLGNFTYENTLLAAVLVTAVYYILFYAFLRVWLKNAAYAWAGLLLALKIHIFSVGPEEYLVWKYPSVSVIRYFFDGTFFLLLALHARDLSRKAYLFAAFLVAGIGLFYVTDTGVYLLVTAYAYWGMLLVSPGPRREMIKGGKDAAAAGLALLVPWATGFVLVWCFAGAHVADGAFWNNLKEYIALALGGFEGLPVSWGVQKEMFAPFLLGVLMLAVYLFSLAVSASLCLLRRHGSKSLLLLPLSVYGLCIYHYFVFRSSPRAFYVIDMPFVAILCYLLARAARDFPSETRRKAGALALAAAAGLLIASPSLWRYPNVFNSGREMFSVDQAYYEANFDIGQDAAMIAALTKPEEKVALVSSFETSFLSRAGRKPFFYYFPLVNSRYLHVLDFGGMKVYTRPQLAKILRQLETEKPRYVFIETKLFAPQIPKIYFAHFSALREIVVYLREHYQPVHRGKYLLAIERK